MHVPFAVAYHQKTPASVPKTSQEALRDAWSRVLEEIDSEGPRPDWSLLIRSERLKVLWS